MKTFKNDNHEEWLKVGRLALEMAREVYSKNYYLKHEKCFELEDVKQQLLLWYSEWRETFQNDNEFQSPSDSFRYCCTKGWVAWRVLNWTRQKDFGSMSGCHDSCKDGYKDSPQMFSSDALSSGRAEQSHTINMTEEEESVFVHPSPDPAKEFEAERDQKIIDDLAAKFLSDGQYLIYAMTKQGYSRGDIASALGVSGPRVTQQKQSIISILQEQL